MKKIIGVLAFVSAISLTATVAYAAIPDANGTIHGCRSNITHILTIRDPAVQASCGLLNTEVNFAEQGPEGPQGPVGPQGPQGLPAPTPTHSEYTKSIAMGVGPGDTGAQVSIQCDRNINSDVVVQGSSSYGFYTLTTEITPVVGAHHVSVYFDGAITHAHGGSQTYVLAMEFDAVPANQNSSLFVQVNCFGPNP